MVIGGQYWIERNRDNGNSGIWEREKKKRNKREREKIRRGINEIKMRSK